MEPRKWNDEVDGIKLVPEPGWFLDSLFGYLGISSWRTLEILLVLYY